MHWRYKALLQRSFSHLPHGENLNYLFQRYVTRSLPPGDQKFLQSVDSAEIHLRAYQQHGRRPIGSARFYEFGAGWTMLGPLTFYAAGVNRQVLVDIRRLIRPPLINATIERFQRLLADRSHWRIPLRRVSDSPAQAIRDLEAYYGIRYLAPMDARKTDLADGSIDCITSHNTLEHIPAADVAGILQECRRVLCDDGLMSFRVDYQDHYSYFDKRISVYNFLRFGQRQWCRYSPGLHYQNRLRHRDYLALYTAAGFVVAAEQRRGGSDEDLAVLKGLPLDPSFGNYSLSDLAVRGADVVLVPRLRVPVSNGVVTQSSAGVPALP